MKRETRTRIADPDDAIRAAFQLFADILENPERVPEVFNGATFRPVERVEESLGKGVKGSVSFEVTLAESDERATRLPEMERVLVKV